MYYVRIKNDKANRRWLVREAVSLRAAYNEIIMAMATGSIGGKGVRVVHEGEDRREQVLADVVRVNSDLTEAVPYQTAY